MVSDPKANPLVGDRRERERELLKLVSVLAAEQNRDGAEVMAELSAWNGHSVLNPASMTDDRLLHVLLEARRRLGSAPGSSSGIPDWQRLREIRRRHPEMTLGEQHQELARRKANVQREATPEPVEDERLPGETWDQALRRRIAAEKRG